MNFIEPSVELIEEKDPYKKIELAGRTCYKSEAKITDDSAIKFVQALIKREHYAMLEHQIFLFEVFDNSLTHDYIEFLKQDKYLHVTSEIVKDDGNFKLRHLVSGSVRAICQRNINDPIFQCLYLKYPNLCFGLGCLLDPMYNEENSACFVDLEKEISTFNVNELLEHVYFTFKIITDRGVTHELVRHRPCSFAQESTRYVNYKDGISIALPSGFYEKSEEIRGLYEYAFELAERLYGSLILHGETPQQARAVLPTATKTEIVITTNLKEYIHILNLRYRGTTGTPHPDIKIIAEMIYNLIKDNFYKNIVFDINNLLNMDSKKLNMSQYLRSLKDV